MMVEARDIDMESKMESGFGASEHPPCPHCEEIWVRIRKVYMNIKGSMDVMSIGTADVLLTWYSLKS